MPPWPTPRNKSTTVFQLTPTDCPELHALWTPKPPEDISTPGSFPTGPQTIPDQFLVLVTCRDEKHQVELLRRFAAEGLQYKALLA